MPTSPAAWEGAALELRRIYANAEAIMLARIAQEVEKDIHDERWEQLKLADIRRIRADVERQIRRLDREGTKAIEKAVGEAYRGGAKEAIEDLRKVTDRPLATGFGVTHQRAVERIAGAAAQRVQGTHLRILRVADDMYRRVVADAVTYSSTGVMTRREAAQAALNVFADEGITGFVDRAGRNWDVSSYCEMATRTAAGRAAVEGHIDRAKENGYDLVIVSHSPSPCEKCDPWEGRILSLGGEHAGEYPTVDEAHAAGLQHPNCTHSIGIYVPGLTEKPKRLPKEQRRESYEARSRQREIERNIRKYKRREAVALDDAARQDARAMVRKWQAEQRKHLEDAGRSFKRDYGRESITSAR